jgi:hypothetical protein
MKLMEGLRTVHNRRDEKRSRQDIGHMEDNLKKLESEVRSR